MRRTPSDDETPNRCAATRTRPTHPLIDGEVLLHRSIAVGAGVIVDPDREAFARHGQVEIERHVDIGERRDVEELRFPVAESRGRPADGAGREAVGPEQVGLGLVEGVRNFRNGGERLPLPVEAEIERHRVEDMPKDAR